jgi:hypothetical protein
MPFEAEICSPSIVCDSNAYDCLAKVRKAQRSRSFSKCSVTPVHFPIRAELLKRFELDKSRHFWEGPFYTHKKLQVLRSLEGEKYVTGFGLLNKQEHFLQYRRSGGGAIVLSSPRIKRALSKCSSLPVSMIGGDVRPLHFEFVSKEGQSTDELLACWTEIMDILGVKEFTFAVRDEYLALWQLDILELAVYLGFVAPDKIKDRLEKWDSDGRLAPTDWHPCTFCNVREGHSSYCEKTGHFRNATP